MLKILFSLFLFLSSAFGCYSVSISPTDECVNKGEFEQTFIDAGEFEPGSIGNTFQVPVYIRSDSLKQIKMKMAPVNLINNSHYFPVDLGVVNALFQSNITGNSVTFTKNKKVELLPKGYSDSRDGSTLIGYITFIFPDLEELQSHGEYRARTKIKLYEKNKASKSFNVDIYFTVSSVLVVGLEDVSSESGNKVFKSADIDLGNLNLESTTQAESNVYLKSNYDYACVYLRFNNTPDLKHKISEETIKMDYYYKRQNSFSYTKINSGSEYLLYYMGNLGGDSSIANMRFVAQSAKGKAAGDYGAVVSVTISVQ